MEAPDHGSLPSSYILGKIKARCLIEGIFPSAKIDEGVFNKLHFDQFKIK